MNLPHILVMCPAKYSERSHQLRPSPDPQLEAAAQSTATAKQPSAWKSGVMENWSSREDKWQCSKPVRGARPDLRITLALHDANIANKHAFEQAFSAEEHAGDCVEYGACGKIIEDWSDVTHRCARLQLAACSAISQHIAVEPESLEMPASTRRRRFPRDAKGRE